MKFVRAAMKFLKGLMNLWRWFFPTLSDVQKRLENEDETKRKKFEAFERKIGEARLAFNHNLVDFYVLRTKVASLRADLASNWTEFKMRLKHFIEHDIFGQHLDFVNDFLEQHQNLSQLDATQRLFKALDEYVKQAFEGCDLDWVSDLAGDMDLEASLTVLHWCRNVIGPIMESEPSLLEHCNTLLTRILDHSRWIASDLVEAVYLKINVNREIHAAVRMIFQALKQHNAADHAAGLTELVGHLTGLENQNRDFEDLQRLFQAYKEEIEKNQSELKKLLVTHQNVCRVYDGYQSRRFIGPYSPWLQALNGAFTERFAAPSCFDLMGKKFKMDMNGLDEVLNVVGKKLDDEWDDEVHFSLF